MPKTMGATSGDGQTQPFVSAQLTLPDAGSTVTIEGAVMPVGGTEIAITGSPLTAPSPPGSGLIYWIIQVNTTTGVATVKQDPASMPTADAGNVVVFSDSLAPADTNLAADSDTSMKDQW